MRTTHPIAVLVTCLLVGCAVPQLQALPKTTGAALGPISGQLQLPAGVDAGRLAVLVYPTGAKPGASPYTGTVDAAGHFAVQAPLGGDYTLIVQDTQNKVSGLVRHVLDDGTATVNVDIAPNGMASGMVQVSPGVPAVGVWVYVPGTNLVAITDATGAYTFGNLPVGSQTLMAQGLGFTSITLDPVTVVAGVLATVDLATIGTLSLVGAAGQPGANGVSLETGNVVPRGPANVGDTYLDTATGGLYSSASGFWMFAGSLKGAAGNSGAPGAAGVASQGTAGVNGINGAKFTSGVGAPTTLGSDGDTYLDSYAGNTYLQVSSAWMLTGNLRGSTVGNGGNTTSLAGHAGATDIDDTGALAVFVSPMGVVADNLGNAYVVEASGPIRKVAPGGVVTTQVSTPTSTDFGIVMDHAGNWYFSQVSGNDVEMTTPGGVTTTFAGTFDQPHGLAIDPQGNLFVADTNNNEIREISPAGVVTTLAGNPTPGHADGVGAAASFTHPFGVAVDARDNVFVADSANNEIRKIAPGGVVTTLAGNPAGGAADGAGVAASFSNPEGLAVDVYDNVYVADSHNNEIRVISPAGLVTTLAGATLSGNANGVGAAASFQNPIAIAVDAGQNLYVVDAGNFELRLIQ